MKNEPVKSWHRQPNEPARHFAMFEFFLSMPAVERTSEKVAKKFAKTLQWIQRVRAVQNWNDRAHDRDNFLALELDKKAVKQSEAAAFDFDKWNRENLKKARSIADKLFARTMEILDLPVVEQVVKNPIVDKDGQVHFQIVTLKPVKYSAADAPRYAEAALILAKYISEQERLLDPKQRHNPRLPQPSKPIAEMSPAELEVFINERKEAQRLLISPEGVQDIGEQPQ